MKLHILSDLHLEFMPFAPPPTDADVVVLAGDIDVGARALSWAALDRLGDRPILYVAGNHEYYGRGIADVDAALRAQAAARPNLHLLEKDELRIGGVRFLGTTLWTDFDLDGAERHGAATAAAAGLVLDFRKILSPSGGYLTPEETVTMHHQSLAWLRRKLAEPFAGKTVVVTHHAPHPHSVHARFAGNAINAAFVSDLGAEMGTAALWIHGHTHDSFDYRVRATRVVANPRGYCRKVVAGDAAATVVCENAAFDPGLLVEV